MFTAKLNRSGNLDLMDKRKKFNFGNPKEDLKDQYSQVSRMRTAVQVFKCTSLDLLKELSIGGGSGGTHFIRCIKTNLNNEPKLFHVELVRQQIRGMAVVPTAKARQKGYSCRITFPEFLRRYKFLAFDFNENVEVSRDNCRLLLIRLQMEGWVIGKSKVFLRYYNEEYLSRLYEIQVKKVIKIQSMIRAFITKRKVSKLLLQEKEKAVAVLMNSDDINVIQARAAIIIQKGKLLQNIF